MQLADRQHAVFEESRRLHRARQTDLRRKPAATSPEIYHRLYAAAIRLFRCIVREALSASAVRPHPDRFQQLLSARVSHRLMAGALLVRCEKKVDKTVTL